MTNYRAILEYHYKGNTTTQVAKICECSRTTVLRTIKRAKECGLTKTIVEQMRDRDLLLVLYPKRVNRVEYDMPDFRAIDKDRVKRRLTKYVAWRRYCKRTIAAGGKPYSKSQFFKLYKEFASRYDFRFKSTQTIKQINIFLTIKERALRIVGETSIAYKEAIDDISRWCKKMRLRPERL